MLLPVPSCWASRMARRGSCPATPSPTQMPDLLRLLYTPRTPVMQVHLLASCLPTADLIAAAGQLSCIRPVCAEPEPGSGSSAELPAQKAPCSPCRGVDRGLCCSLRPFTHTPSAAGQAACGVGRPWVCEHRWPAIAGMVQFRAAVKDQPLTRWQSFQGGDVVAFGRGNAGLVLLNAGKHEHVMHWCVASLWPRNTKFCMPQEGSPSLEAWTLGSLPECMHAFGTRVGQSVWTAQGMQRCSC